MSDALAASYARASPARVVGVEVLPTLPGALACVEAAREAEQRELEFWRGIIPPITPAELAARRIAHSRSAKQCASAQVTRRRARVNAAAERGAVEKSSG